MVGSGRISVLASEELQILSQALRGLDRELAAQIRAQTREMAEPEWQEAVRGNVTDRLQTRVLSDSARVSVSDQNVMLRSGGIGKMSDGTPKATLALGAEFGAHPGVESTVVNRHGTRYQRHARKQFRLPRSRGYVVWPAARDIIPRIASLWVQTAVRTLHEQLEKGGVR
jgi:hypothetical protein